MSTLSWSIRNAENSILTHVNFYKREVKDALILLERGDMDNLKFTLEQLRDAINEDLGEEK